MRSLILTAVLALVLGPGAVAQRPAGAGGYGLFAGITLTAEQQQRVDSIRAAHEPVREAMQASRQPGQGRDSARIAMRTAMQAEMQRAYRAVLTPEQQPVFDRNVERMGARPGPCGASQGGRGGRGGPGGPPK